MIPNSDYQEILIMFDEKDNEIADLRAEREVLLKALRKLSDKENYYSRNTSIEELDTEGKL